MITKKPVSYAPAELAALNSRFNSAHASEICRWAADTFASDLIMTSSFGAESMCTIHLATTAKPDIKILVVNTGYLFPETLAFMQQMKERFHLNIAEYKTKNDPVVWLTINNEPDPRVRQNIDACCAANKNEVFDRGMRELAPAAWIRGTRADQTPERAQMNIVQWSKRNNCWAVSPILRWNTRQIFQYMKEHGLPHHPLWEKGYTSIGCSPETCTRPVIIGEDPRTGRWGGSDKKECGINLDNGE